MMGVLELLQGMKTSWEVVRSPYEVHSSLEIDRLLSKGLSYSMICNLRVKVGMCLVELV